MNGANVQKCGPLRLLASDYLLSMESAGHILYRLTIINSTLYRLTLYRPAYFGPVKKVLVKTL